MKRTLAYLSIAAISLASCAKAEFSPLGEDNPNEVRLYCAVGHPGVSLDASTKAGESHSGIINPETELEEPLDIAFLRADRTSDSFVPSKPDSNLVFRNNIPSADQDTNPDSPKYKTAIQYYWSTAKVSDQMDANCYRRITDFGQPQYFKGLDDYPQYLAWCPQGTVNSSGDGSQPFSVTQNLDLRTDVMFTNLATESITGAYSDTLVFSHALCQFRIWVYRMQEIGDDGEELTTNSWGYLNDVVVAKNTEHLTYTLDNQAPGKITYDYGTSRLDRRLSEEAFPDAPGSEGVFFTPDNEIMVGYEQKQYVACFLAAPPKEGILQLVMETVKNIGATPIENAVTIASDFKPGYAYDVILCFSDHGIINDDTSISEWSFKNEEGIKYDVTAKMYYDLSRYGTANSYIVASSNVGYTFKGNVKGCGNENGGATVVGCDDWSIPEDAYIDILYASDSETPSETQLLDLSNHALIDGNITFTVPGNPVDNTDMTLYRKGNVIIAAYDYKGGNILWSWHIWLTDRPKEQGYGSGFSFMDRNLGALVAPATPAAVIAQLQSSDRDRHGNRLENGYYYQWGRKDPIIPGWSQYSGEKVTIETASKNVNTFYGASLSGDARGWHVKELGVDDANLWGYSSSENMVKSIYDPCPPGYRLPEHNSWFKKFNGVNFINYHDTAGEASIADAVGHKSDAMDGHILDHTSGNGCITGVRNYCAGGLYNVSGVYVWYPGTGWIYAEEAPTSGPVVPYSTETNVYASNNAYSFNAVKAALDLEALIDNADACPVRCVSTNAEDMVTNLSKTQTANSYIIPSAGDYKFKADVKGNGANRVSVGGTPVTVLDVDVNISHTKASFYTVLWWQGDLSGADGKNSNSAGSKCPIKFANSGKRLPTSPGRADGTDFTDDDITVMDADGFIQFSIEEADYCHGNAIIAAFDANKNILWSWHLWLTDEPSKIKFGPRNFSETYTDPVQGNVTVSSTKTYYAMDRNLGSTYLPSSSSDISGDSEATLAKVLGSYGMYYQWGRKDPFPGPATAVAGRTTGYSSSTWWKRNVSGDFSWSSHTALEAANPVASREDAIPTPTTYYMCNFQNVWSTLQQHTGLKYVNWHTTDWEASDNRSKYISMWGCSSDTPKSAYNPRMSKTINDPCPPGYYIPDHYLFAAGDLGVSGMDNAMSDDGASENVSARATTNTYGIFINPGSGTYGSGLDKMLWLPYAGYRNGIDGNMMNRGEYNMYGSGIGAEIFGLVLRLFGIDPYSHLAAQNHCAMDFNAFSKNSDWGKTYVRALSVRPTPNNTAVIQAGQLANLPSDGTPIRCRAY